MQRPQKITILTIIFVATIFMSSLSVNKSHAHAGIGIINSLGEGLYFHAAGGEFTETLKAFNEAYKTQNPEKPDFKIGDAIAYSYTPTEYETWEWGEENNIMSDNFSFRNWFKKDNSELIGFATIDGKMVMSADLEPLMSEEDMLDLSVGKYDTLHLYAKYQSKEYTITYNPNHDNKEAYLKTYTYNTRITIDNAPTRSGYYFAGWNTEPDGSGERFAAGKTTTNVGDITLYAQWNTSFTLTFDSNGEPARIEGEMTDITCIPGNWYDIPACNYKKYTANGESAFLGWSTSRTGNGELYNDSSEITLYEDTVLYAIWDDYPFFHYKEVPNRYYTIEEAMNGDITEEDLLSTVAVGDENGILKKYTKAEYVSGTPGVTIVDFNGEEFKQFNKPGAVSVRYKAVDNMGQITYMDIMVYIQKNKVRSGNSHYVRSISEKYYNAADIEDGALKASSIWYMPENRSIIQNTFNNATTYDYSFSEDRIKEIKNYLNTTSDKKSKESLNYLINLLKQN